MIGVLDRKYPANRVRDEADVVKIEAHARLGHTAEAEQAAKNFLSTRPQSPYAPRVRRALSNMHATP
jgi:outer membrane protein assembly factor BamD (BamD/ComL family)